MEFPQRLILSSARMSERATIRHKLVTKVEYGQVPSSGMHIKASQLVAYGIHPTDGVVASARKELVHMIITAPMVVL